MKKFSKWFLLSSTAFMALVQSAVADPYQEIQRNNAEIRKLERYADRQARKGDRKEDSADYAATLNAADRRSAKARQAYENSHATVQQIKALRARNEELYAEMNPKREVQAPAPSTNTVPEENSGTFIDGIRLADDALIIGVTGNFENDGSIGQGGTGQGGTIGQGGTGQGGETIDPNVTDPNVTDPNVTDPLPPVKPSKPTVTKPTSDPTKPTKPGTNDRDRDQKKGSTGSPIPNWKPKYDPTENSKPKADSKPKVESKPQASSKPKNPNPVKPQNPNSGKPQNQRPKEVLNTIPVRAPKLEANAPNLELAPMEEKVIEVVDNCDIEVKKDRAVYRANRGDGEMFAKLKIRDCNDKKKKAKSRIKGDADDVLTAFEYNRNHPGESLGIQDEALSNKMDKAVFDSREDTDYAATRRELRGEKREAKRSSSAR